MKVGDADAAKEAAAAKKLDSGSGFVLKVGRDGGDKGGELLLQGEAASKGVESGVVVGAECAVREAEVLVFIALNDAVKDGALQEIGAGVDAFAITEREMGFLVGGGGFVFEDTGEDVLTEDAVVLEQVAFVNKFEADRVVELEGMAARGGFAEDLRGLGVIAELVEKK